MKLNNLSNYTQIDYEKHALINSVLSELNKIDLKRSGSVFHSMGVYEKYSDDESQALCLKELKLSKICPKCGKKYPEDELFCFDCAVTLKDGETLSIRNFDVKHDFPYCGKNTYLGFDEILTDENLDKITEFDFTSDDFEDVIRNIKLTALKNLDCAVKENDIVLDDITVLEKVILFIKSFINLEYKSYGPELGLYSFNTISVDDRQPDALQITTLLHELTHFLIKEIFTQVLCRLLDASKTNEMESVTSFILAYLPENCLIDEYAAHTVEGRFTLIGYQNYSSFLNIQKTVKRDENEIEMLKTIGNTLANIIKDIVESFIDDNLLDEIKNQFKEDILERPDYSQLYLENCTLLNDVGFLKALEFILSDGFAVAMDNTAKLIEINGMW